MLSCFISYLALLEVVFHAQAGFTPFLENEIELIHERHTYSDFRYETVNTKVEQEWVDLPDDTTASLRETKDFKDCAVEIVIDIPDFKMNRTVCLFKDTKWARGLNGTIELDGNTYNRDDFIDEVHPVKGFVVHYKNSLVKGYMIDQHFYGTIRIYDAYTAYHIHFYVEPLEMMQFYSRHPVKKMDPSHNAIIFEYVGHDAEVGALRPPEDVAKEQYETERNETGGPVLTEFGGLSYTVNVTRAPRKHNGTVATKKPHSDSTTGGTGTTPAAGGTESTSVGTSTPGTGETTKMATTDASTTETSTDASTTEAATDGSTTEAATDGSTEEPSKKKRDSDASTTDASTTTPETDASTTGADETTLSISPGDDDDDDDTTTTEEPSTTYSTRRAATLPPILPPNANRSHHTTHPPRTQGELRRKEAAEKLMAKENVPQEIVVAFHEDVIGMVPLAGGVSNSDIFDTSSGSAHLCTMCIWVEPLFADVYGFKKGRKYGASELVEMLRRMDWLFRAMDFNVDSVAENFGFVVKTMLISDDFSVAEHRKNDKRRRRSPRRRARKRNTDKNESTTLPPDSSNMTSMPTEPGSHNVSHPPQAARPKKVYKTLLAQMEQHEKFQNCCVRLAFVQLDLTPVISVATIRGLCSTTNLIVLGGLMHGHKIGMYDIQRALFHAMGHQMGAEHDRTMKAKCQDRKPSKYYNPFIMHPVQQANVGLRTNSFRFSSCSKLEITAFLDSNNLDNCLLRDKDDFCGNGMVEEGEECDCASAWQCHLQECCGESDTIFRCKVTRMGKRVKCERPRVW